MRLVLIVYLVASKGYKVFRTVKYVVYTAQLIASTVHNNVLLFVLYFMIKTRQYKNKQ